MKTRKEIANQFKRHKATAETGLMRQLSNTKDCQAFYAGNFMRYTDRVQFNDGRGKKAAMVQFNKVKPYINAVKGFMAQNRRKPKYAARVQSQQLQVLYSDYLNAYSDYIRDNANADQIETQQDGDLLINGYGAVETALSYGEGFSSSNPNGEIIMGRLDPLTVSWDPTAEATNLLDARFVFYKKQYYLEEALQLFNDSAADDFDSAFFDFSGNKVYFPDGGRYNTIQEFYDFADVEENLVNVYFYQWYDIEEYWRIDNPLASVEQDYLESYQIAMDALADKYNDEPFPFNPRDKIVNCTAAVKAEIEKVFPGLDFGAPYNGKVYYTAVLSKKKVFTSYRNIDQTGFTIKFKTGDFDSDKRIWVGMVNSLMEPVLYHSKALTELMLTIASNSKGGVIIEEGGVFDISEFESKYAKTDAVIVVPDGTVSGNKIMPKKEPYSPNGTQDIITIADAAIPDVVGIDKSFLGSLESKQETAALQRQRIKQVTTALACYFDSITLYQKTHAKMMIPFIRVLAENNAGNMFASASDNGLEYIEINPEALAEDYDIMIEDAPDSATERDEKAIALIGMGDKLMAAGQIDQAKQIYSQSLKYMPFAGSDRSKISEILETQAIDPVEFATLQQQLQMAQQIINELQAPLTEAEYKNKSADAALKLAKIEETVSKIRLNNAETLKTKAEVANGSL